MKAPLDLRRTPNRGSAAFVAALALSGARCGPTEAANEPGIQVGLLLPFTGPSSATASNFERSVLYAADRINSAGGIRGVPLRFIARDTHSNTGRSRQAVQQLVDEGVSVVLGPESADIAAEVAPILAESGVAFVSPLIGAATDTSLVCEPPWFRLAPSAKALGEALAKLLSAEGIRRAAVLSASDAYNDALGRAASHRFQRLGGEIAFEAKLTVDAQSYGAIVTRAADQDVEAVVLAASPRTGALVVNEFHVISPDPPRWFLSPLLKTDLFTLNVDPAALEGAVGVAPKIYDTSRDFPDDFAERWLGDEPLEGAFFYYDAVALLALALEKAQEDPNGRPDFESLQEAIIEVAAPPGEGVGWDEIEAGLRRLHKGHDVYYSGLTGPMLLDGCGKRRLGVTTQFAVRGGAIENRD